MTSPFLTRKQAAEYLGVKPHTLAMWAHTGQYKLKYIKMGRLVKYRKEDLDQFINDRTICHTGEII